MPGQNQSSVILNFTLAADAATPDGAKFLTGGDAEVFIWNRQWQRHEAETEVLEYDIMQTPHHCSWHSLSYDSWSKCGEKAKLDADARKALSQTRDGAVIVASCKPIKADDSDPPCIRAKREYVEIVEEAKGEFYCTGEYPSEKSVEPLVFTVTSQGVQPLEEGSWIEGRRRDHLRANSHAARGIMTDAIADALHKLQRHRGLTRVGEPKVIGASTQIEVDVAVQLPNRSRRSGVSETGVRAVETCVLVFGGDWPLSAPKPFLRADFPLNLPHINPHREGELVSPCLFEGSLNELLHRFGLDAIVDQLVDWLHKAAAGTLLDLEQGWEPTRRDSCPSTVVFSAERSRPPPR